MKIPKYLKLKVYVNRRTGQSTVILPKKKFNKKKLPKEVKVSW